jgi:hypothetical protein
MKFPGLFKNVNPMISLTLENYYIVTSIYKPTENVHLGIACAVTDYGNTSYFYLHAFEGLAECLKLK